MSGFSIAWLNLREAADVSARDRTLARRAIEWVGAAPLPGMVCVDLASGTGSTLGALARLDTVDFPDHGCWRLVDHDPVLLDEALRRHGGQYQIATYENDLNEIDALPLSGAHLVTASALFDLVSRNFIERLAAKLSLERSALYAALNYDGTTTWSPVHALDEDVLAAFNRDQCRDKGLGQALGPEATSCLQATLMAAGYEVSLASSPWLLGPADHALTKELVNGIAGAAATDSTFSGHPDRREQLKDWQNFRLAHAGSGHCRVGHCDLLALPVSTV
ncbi:MAG: hypothetical protein RQ899_08395 [Pseudomonadales bacterium]|nr:hypothetical protein [Pseudomonadales bacterium]